MVGDGGVEISLSRLVSASLSSVVCDELDLERDMSKLFFAPSWIEEFEVLKVF